MWFLFKNNDFVACGQNIYYFVYVCVCVLKLLWQIYTGISLCTLSGVKIEWICSVLGTLYLDCQGFIEIWEKALHLNVVSCLSTLYCGLGITVYTFEL